MTKIVLILECLLVCIPLAVIIVVGLILQFDLAVPSALLNDKFDGQLAALLMGNLCGVYAVSVLIKLCWFTIEGKPFQFGFLFYVGIVCGLIASWSIFYSSQSLGLAALISLPPLMLASHFSYIQKFCRANKSHQI